MSDPIRNESKKTHMFKIHITHIFLISTSHLSCIVAVDANTELMKHHLMKWLLKDHRLNVDTSHGMVLLQWTKATEISIALWFLLMNSAVSNCMGLIHGFAFCHCSFCQHTLPTQNWSQSHKFSACTLRLISQCWKWHTSNKNVNSPQNC